MGFFTSESGGVEVAPQAPWQKKGRKYLEGLLGRNVEFEPAPVAGMSGIEQMGLGALEQFVSGAGFEDPRSSPYWTALRDISKREEAEAVQGLRRRHQLSGMLESSPSYFGEADVRREYGEGRMGLLGELYENERIRNSPMARAQAGLTLGSLPRMLEQMEQDAAYQAAMRTQMFPFETQANIAQSLMSHQPSTYMSAPQPSGFSQVAGPLAMLMMATSMMGNPFASPTSSAGWDPSQFGTAGAPGAGFDFGPLA